MNVSAPQEVTIVVCDDQPAVAEGLARVLEAEDDRIRVAGVATSAADAERLVQETLPDVVVMDIYMPGRSGIEATRRIRELSPATKVLILTVSDREDDLYAAIKAGALGYVTKDQDPAQIAQAIVSVRYQNYTLPVHLADRMLRDLSGGGSIEHLTEEEKTILAEIAQGRTDREIAHRLHLSERTIRRRIHNIYEKLHLTDRIEAAVFASRRGLAPKLVTDQEESDATPPLG